MCSTRKATSNWGWWKEFTEKALQTTFAEMEGKTTGMLFNINFHFEQGKGAMSGGEKSGSEMSIFLEMPQLSKN